MKIANCLMCVVLACCFDVVAESVTAGNKIAENIYVIPGGGGKGSNVGVILEEDGVVLIDTMVPDSREYLVQQLASISSKPVKRVLVTHDHFDHVGSAVFYGKKGAQVVGSKNMQLEEKHPALKFAGQVEIDGNKNVILGYTIDAHASSDVLYYLPTSNVIFLGDIYTDEWYPSFFSGGWSGQKAAINRALELGDDDTRYVPGHGKIATRKDLQQYLLWCEKWVSRIRHLHAKGLSPEEMTKDKVLLDVRESFSNENTNRQNFDKWFALLVENTIKAN